MKIFIVINLQFQYQYMYNLQFNIGGLLILIMADVQQFPRTCIKTGNQIRSLCAICISLWRPLGLLLKIKRNNV